MLCDLLLRSGHSVTLFDRFFFGKKPISGIAKHPRLTVVKGEIRNTKKLSPLLRSAKAVVHLASLSNDPSCDLDPEWSVQVNHEATVRLADAAIEAGCPRFIFASSCSVYGHGSNRLLKETSPCNPVSLYAKLKLKSEEELLKRGDNGFCPVILRQATIFGLSPRMRFDLAINQMTLHAITRKKIFVLGGGKQWRPFLHVRDAAAIFKKAVEAKREKVFCGIFNVGSNENNFRIGDLARKVKKIIGNVEIEVTPEDADRRDYNVDFSRVKQVLDFGRGVDISDAVNEIAGFIKKAPGRDYNSSEFFNIIKLNELAKTTAKAGGEPVRQSLLTFAQSHETAGEKPTAKRRPRKGEFDFVREGEGFDMLIRACRLSPGSEIVIGATHYARLAERLKKYRMKIRMAKNAHGSLALDPESVKKEATPGTSAVFFSEFDNTKSIKAAGRALKIVVTSVAPEGISFNGADAVVWSSDVAPGVASAPAVRVSLKNGALKKRFETVLRKRTEEWLETPLAGDLIRAGFDRLEDSYSGLKEKTKRIAKAIGKTSNVAPLRNAPAGMFALLFDTESRANRFKRYAKAENLECTALPPNWETRSVRPGNLIFLPVGPATGEKEIDDIVRILEKIKV